MIRPFQEQDTEELVGVWLRASLRAHDFIPAAYWIAQTEAMRTLYLPLSETVVYRDDTDGTLVGFLSFVDDWLAGLFVEPLSQGKGVGTRLLRLGLRMHPKTSLSVYAANTRARCFYEKHGFRLVEERREEATGQLEFVLAHGLF